MYGEGISREGEILDMASELDIVQKSGAWYSYNEERLGQGRENSKQFLKENTDLREEIAFFIREHHGISEDSVLRAQKIQLFLIKNKRHGLVSFIFIYY